MMSNTSQRWSPSWDPHPRSFWSAARSAISIGILKVCATHTPCPIDIGLHRLSGIPLLTVKGNWIAATPIPDQSLETRETRLGGKDKELLLALARKILRWLPEERPSAEGLFEDPFLNQYMFAGEADHAEA